MIKLVYTAVGSISDHFEMALSKMRSNSLIFNSFAFALSYFDSLSIIYAAI
jgi:hypothetical protein